MSGNEELYLAIGAVVVLALSVLGLDAAIFRKRRPVHPLVEIPKQRVHYIMEDADDEDADAPEHLQRR